MKKIFIVMVLSIMLTFGLIFYQPVITTISVSESIETNTDTKDNESELSLVFREKIVPFFITYGSSIISALGVAWVFLKKLRKATEDLGLVKTDNTKLIELVKNKDAEIAQLKQDIKEIKKDTSDTKKMVKIGLCNLPDLVANGYASEIAKVANDEENN